MNECVVSGVADAVRCCKVDDSVLICENNFYFAKHSIVDNRLVLILNS